VSHISTVMAHFEVPGWSVPVSPAESPRKRKRPGNDDKVQSVEANLDRLVKRLRRNDHDDSAGFKQDKSTRHSGEGGNVGRRGKRMGKRRSQGTEVLKSSNKDSIISGPLPLQKVKKRKYDEVALDRQSSSQKPLPKGGLLGEISSGLTSLQKGMKQSLEGARFR
jgi:ribosomal RNA-processing protein 8